MKKMLTMLFAMSFAALVGSAHAADGAAASAPGQEKAAAKKDAKKSKKAKKQNAATPATPAEPAKK
jgi:ABC-type transporter MlaC component